MIGIVAFALGLSIQAAEHKVFAELLPAETELFLTFHDPAGQMATRLIAEEDSVSETGPSAHLRFHDDFNLAQAIGHIHGELSIAWLTLPNDDLLEVPPFSTGILNRGDVIYVLPGPGGEEFERDHANRLLEAEDRGVEVRPQLIAGVEVTVLAGSVYTFPLGDAFVVTFSEEHARDVIGRARGNDESSLQAVTAFQSVRQALDAPGPSFTMYEATGRVWDRMIEPVDRLHDGTGGHAHGFRCFNRFSWEELGLTAIEALGMGAAFGPDRTEIRGMAYCPRGPVGILRNLSDTRNELVWPEFQTDDWDLVFSFRLNAMETVDMLVRALVARFGDRARPEDLVPPDFRQGILENLTGVFTVLGVGRGASNDFVLLSAVRDPNEVGDTLTYMAQGIPLDSELPRGAPTYRQEEYMGTVLHVVHDALGETVTTVYGGYLILGPGVEPVRRVLQRIGHPGRALQDRDEFQGLRDGLPATSRTGAYFTARGFLAFWQLFQPGSHVDVYCTNWGWLGSLFIRLQRWYELGPATWLKDGLPYDWNATFDLGRGFMQLVPRDDGALLRIVLEYEED